MSVQGGVRTGSPESLRGSADDWEQCDVDINRIVRPPSDDVDTTAFQRLRLVAPPPAQDGGRFDAADPFLRHQSPQHHAQYDPNAAYLQPVSPATATAAVARFGPLDPVLLAGLENPRERLSLLKFEDQIVRFIRNPREMQLSFPPLSSYHRLIIHRLADRCCLEHQTADYNPYSISQGYDGNASRVVTLFKTAQTIVPRVLLIDLSVDKQQPTVTPASAPKIMLRKRAPSRGDSNGGRGDGASRQAQQRTIEDRERAYAEARARIFGEDASSTAESSSTSSTDDAQGNRSQQSSSNSAAATALRPGGGHHAGGPDGTKGFARGGAGRGNSPATATQQRTAPDAGVESRPKAVDTRQPQNWKESRVLWRNREQEMNDPEFTRNHDAYRPSRGSQSINYDGARSFGYPNARGRAEFNRSELNQRPAPPPPSSAEPYRQHQHPGGIQPPLPPPPGGYSAGAYSPHTRGGGYSGPPPLPTSSQRRGPAPPPANGAYNEEFPPLGK